MCGCAFEDDNVPSYKKVCSKFGTFFPRSYQNPNDDSEIIHVCTYECQQKRAFAEDLIRAKALNKDDPIQLVDLSYYDYLKEHLPQEYKDRVVY